MTDWRSICVAGVLFDQRPDHRMRYFIHIRLGRKVYEDHEGREFSCLEAACDEAMQAVQVLLVDEDLAKLPEEQAFDIRSEAGETLMIVPFSQAFALR